MPGQWMGRSDIDVLGDPDGGDKIFALPAGTAVTIIVDAGEAVDGDGVTFVEILTGDGLAGWVPRAALMLAPDPLGGSSSTGTNTTGTNTTGGAAGGATGGGTGGGQTGGGQTGGPQTGAGPFRALVAGGSFSSDPYDRKVPVAIRSNNAGAINASDWIKALPGYIARAETTPGNKTAIFSAPEYGVAAWWLLLERYAGKGVTTLQDIIDTYGGGQNYSEYVGFVAKKTGFARTKPIPLKGGDADLLAFAKAMFHYEAGRATPLLDAQILYGFALGRGETGAPPAVATGRGSEKTETQPVWTEIVVPPPAPTGTLPDTRSMDGVKALQAILIRLGYLDPPADGAFGRVSRWALRTFAADRGLSLTLPGGDLDPSTNLIDAPLAAALAAAQPLPLVPGTDLAGLIVKAMLKSGYWIARHPSCVNIVYVEGMGLDEKPNDNRNNAFNDLRIVFRVGADGVPRIEGKWDGTTEPGKHFTDEPMDPGGAFHIKFQQYKAWCHGTHHGHEALVQVGDIEGYRDPHKTYKRDYTYPVHGSGFGVNQHWGYDLPVNDLKNSSAGCLVGRTTAGHRAFMALVKADARFVASPTYRFMTAIMPAGDLKPMS